MKSHIIPEFYLKQFSFSKPNDKRYVWLYEQRKKPEPRWTHRAGVEPGYFGFVRPDGTLEESLETKLAEMEHDCDDVLVSARSDLFHCSERSRRKLAFYAALLHSRATQRRDWTLQSWVEIHQQLEETVEDARYLNALADHFTKRYKKKYSPAQIGKEIKNLVRKSTTVEATKNYFLEQLIEYAGMVAGLLLMKPLRVWKAPQGSQFVTSDNPLVSFMVINGHFAPGFGFNHKDTIGALPIAPDACLLFGGDDPSERFYVDANAVDEINWAVIGSADKCVYAKTQDDATNKLVHEILGSYRYGKTSFIPKVPLPHIKDFMRQILGLEISENGTQKSNGRGRRLKSKS